MEREVEVASIWSEPRWRPVIWAVAFVAFSPVLLDLYQHLAAHPWARTALIFPWLGWVAIRSNPERERAPSTRIVWSALLLALALELVAVSGDAPRIARAGFAVGLVGLVWGAGWARLVPALVLVWVIPLPTMLLEILSPGLERGLGMVCAALVPGLALESTGPSPALVTSGGESLVLEPASGGLALLFACAGLGWFRAAARGAEGRTALLAAARWSLASAPTQCGILLLAASLLSAGFGAEVARGLLDHAGWVILLAVGTGLSLPLLRVREPMKAVSC